MSVAEAAKDVHQQASSDVDVRIVIPSTPRPPVKQLE